MKTAHTLATGLDFAHLDAPKTYPSLAAAKRAFRASHDYFRKLGNVANVVGVISPEGQTGPASYVCSTGRDGLAVIERNRAPAYVFAGEGVAPIRFGQGCREWQGMCLSVEANTGSLATLYKLPRGARVDLPGSKIPGAHIVRVV